jgi:hypothetical protein
MSKMLKQTNEYLNNSDCRIFSFSVPLLENKTLWHQAKQHMHQPLCRFVPSPTGFFYFPFCAVLVSLSFSLPFLSFFHFKSLALQKAPGI